MRQNQLRRVKREPKSVNVGGYVYSISEMFEQFMLIKKGEGLAKRTVKEYYNNFQYFMDYIGRELSASEMTTEVFIGWISYMCEELDYSPATVNIRVRTMRSFLRYIFEDKQWIQEPIHKRFKPIKAPIDNVEAFTPEEFKRLIGAIDELNGLVSDAKSFSENNNVGINSDPRVIVQAQTLTISMYETKDGLLIKNEPKVSKAVKNLQTSGYVVNSDGLGGYYIFKNNDYIGWFKSDSITGSYQYLSLFEQTAIDLGYKITKEELQSLVNQASKNYKSNYVFGWDAPGVFFDSGNQRVYIDWALNQDTLTAQTTKALKVIASAGFDAISSPQSSYNIFKDNQYVGTLYYSLLYQVGTREGNYITGYGKYADLLELVALDMGYKGTPDTLKSSIQQVMNDPPDSVNNVEYQNTGMLKISW